MERQTSKSINEATTRALQKVFIVSALFAILSFHDELRSIIRLSPFFYALLSPHTPKSSVKPSESREPRQRLSQQARVASLSISGPLFLFSARYMLCNTHKSICDGYISRILKHRERSGDRRGGRRSFFAGNILG